LLKKREAKLKQKKE